MNFALRKWEIDIASSSLSSGRQGTYGRAKSDRGREMKNIYIQKLRDLIERQTMRELHEKHERESE